MAVVQMERIHVYAMKRDRKKILEFLQRQQKIEVSTSGLEDQYFSKADTSTTQELLTKNAATAVRAMEILEAHSKEDKPGLAFLRGRQGITVDESDGFYDRYDDALRKAQRIVQLDREIAEAKADILKAEGRLEALAPWMELPVPQTFAGTKKTAAVVGSMEGERTSADILAAIAENAPEIGPVCVEVVYASPEVTTFYALSLKKDGQMLEDALRAAGFSRPSAASSRMPAKKKEQLEGIIAQSNKELEAAVAEIVSYADCRADFRMLEDNSKMRAEKYGVIEQLAQSKHVFMMDGYIPAAEAKPVSEQLMNRFDCLVETRELVDIDDEPVAIKNSWFTEPVEGVLEAYSMPGRGEVDPTGVMAIFYYLMFGLMFSDAGYGAIMFGVCLFVYLRFKDNMEPNWSKNVRLFMWCGLSTIIWGVVFSSYFGDVVDVVSRTFFGKEVSIPPLWFYPMEKPMLLLVFCLGIGIIHLSVGYIMKGVTCYKNGDYAGIIYDSVFPIVAWYPLVVILMGSTMFESLAGFRLNLPPSATNICLAITGVAVVGTLLTNGRESKNWGIRLLKGLYAVYNLISGWLGDMLSYSRLLALGLATGVIAGVFNQLGAMGGSGFFGVIMFILVFAVGQALNFGINVLGAYVHSNRLEYVEFFGKFYDGGGRKFMPFGIHTKHYKIIEEESSK